MKYKEATKQDAFFTFLRLSFLFEKNMIQEKNRLVKKK